MTLLPVRSIDGGAGRRRGRSRRRRSRRCCRRGSRASDPRAPRAPVPSMTRTCVSAMTGASTLMKFASAFGFGCVRRRLRKRRPEGLRYECNSADDRDRPTAAASTSDPAVAQPFQACPSSVIAPPPRRSRRDRPGRGPSRSPRPSAFAMPGSTIIGWPPAASSISRMSLRAIVSSKLALKSPRAIFSPRDLIDAARLELREHRQRVGRRRCPAPSPSRTRRRRRRR